VSILVVGLSHKSAPVATLERAAVSGDTLAKLLLDLAGAGPVAEAFVISTCNRVEVYADVDRFHPGVAAISELIGRHCGIPAEELAPHLYAHYEDRAVSHLLAVACGLDSMVVGEDQILGQVRSALRLAAEHGTTGGALGDLGRAALRAGKRARAETGIGRAGASLLNLAMEAVSPGPGALPVPAAGCSPLAGRDVLVVGAGSMSALAVATACRDGARSLVIANRTRRRAERLATRPGVTAARVIGLTGLPDALTAADIVICCTGAARHVITADMVPARRRGDPLVFLDLAMPRDVEPAVAGLPGVTVIGLDTLAERGTVAGADDVAAVRAIMAAELAAYRSAVDAAQAAPVVVALRAKAADVADAELARLAGRLSGEDVSGLVLDEAARTVRRVVSKLLHAPTVRVKELAGSAGGREYATVLRVLFDLDPSAAAAVTRLPAGQDGPREDGTARRRRG
jgi:glutamyl-tRNA reductase